MKTSLLYLVFVATLATLSSDVLVAADDQIAISAGYVHNCVLQSGEVKCWGSNEHGQTGVPALSNPRTISSGGFHTCALDDEGVKCWGNNWWDQLSVPSLRNPKAISAGAEGTCALDDSGVKCWGFSIRAFQKKEICLNLETGGVKKTHCWEVHSTHITDMPTLSNPTSVSSGSYHSCAIDEGTVKCWGWNNLGQTNVPPLKNPRQVSAGIFHSCALDDEGVKCWGGNNFEQSSVPHLVNPQLVSARVLNTCALDDEGVKCWGFNSDGQINVPSLRNPKIVSVGDAHACTLEDAGFKCWGSNTFGQSTIPDEVSALFQKTAIGVSSFEIASLEASFRKLARFVYFWKAGFFKGMATELDKMPLNGSLPLAVQYRIVLARYTFLELAGPIIETTTSPIVQDKVLPNYSRSLEEARKQMGVSSLDSVELVEPVFKALLSTTTLALQASKDYLLSLEDAKEQAQMLSELKALEASQSGKDFLNILNTHRRLITSMAESPKLDGFGALLEKVRTYLERKV